MSSAEASARIGTANLAFPYVRAILACKENYMRLFDEFLRTDDSPAKGTERLYPFLNRSSWPVCDRARVLCEYWFSRYPVSDREDMFERFTSKRDNDHRGAYFELLIHELLLRLGGTVTVHPELARTRNKPDFLVELEGIRLYLEATVSHANQIATGDNPKWESVCDTINEMDIPNHFFYISFSDVPSETPAKRVVFAQIQRLVQLSNGEITRQQLYEDGHHSLAAGFIELSDAYARVRLSPRLAEHVGRSDLPNVMRTGVVGEYDLAQRWRESIRNKAKEKELEEYDAPCIVAIDVMDGFARIGDKGVQAAYGNGGAFAQQSGASESVRGHSWRD